jgi:histidinol-phosphatase (PHP family)
MKIDTHIHSTISCDGKAEIDEMCLSAIRKGFSVICFTEHYDLNPSDDGYDFYNHEKYSILIKQAQDKYSDKITILKGLEFSEPHLYINELEDMSSKDFDFILGSVHWLGSRWIGDRDFQETNTLEQIFVYHYMETLKACKAGRFDSLAHIDFPKRYLLKKHEPYELIREILKTIIEKEISLEINTSPLRKGYNEYYPSKEIIELYKNLGGTLLTMGSDAHNTDDIGADFEKIEINEPLTFSYYQKRKRISF